MNDDSLLIKPVKQGQRVEIVRSFSYKLNCANHGGAQYESMDFFCSEKAECSIEDAVEVSAALYQFCRSEVAKAVVDAKQRLRGKEESRRIA